jgi:hypothetical protein
MFFLMGKCPKDPRSFTHSSGGTLQEGLTIENIITLKLSQIIEMTLQENEKHDLILLHQRHCRPRSKKPHL